MNVPEFTYERKGEWMYITNTDPEPYRKMLYEEQYLKADFGTSGKYMIFSDDYDMLFDLGQMLLIRFRLHIAKISVIPSKKPGTGYAHSLCIYDYCEMLKRQVSDFITDEALSVDYWNRKHPEEKYPFNYRWWKSNKKTAEGEYSWQHLESIGHKTFEGNDIESFKTGSPRLQKHQDRNIFVPGMPFTIDLSEEIINKEDFV